MCPITHSMLSSIWPSCPCIINKEIKESRIRATSKVPVRHKYLMSKVHQEKITWLR
nr:hypothetical protein Iba_chr01cCG1500 [Ipomoea batatas]